MVLFGSAAYLLLVAVYSFVTIGTEFLSCSTVSPRVG
jgi:hypothetical protein